MSRQPTDHGDPDVWGTVLNDYLSVGLNLDGTVKATSFVPERMGVPITLGEVSNDRRLLGSAGAGTSGDVQLTYFTAAKTETITQLAMYSAATAAATVTLIRFGVYSVAVNGDLTLLTATPNDTTLFAATNTRYAKTLSSPWSKAAYTRYAVGFIAVATTVPAVYGPSDFGFALADTLWGRDPRLSGRRAGQTDLPSTITAANVTDTRRGPFVECLL